MSKYTTAFLKNGNENDLKAPGAEVQRVVGDLGDFNRSRVFSKRIKSFEYIYTKVLNAGILSRDRLVPSLTHCCSLFIHFICLILAT